MTMSLGKMAKSELNYLELFEDVMENQKIEVKIDQTGKVSIYIDGVRGKKCDKITEQIVKALGILESKKLKPEYYDDDKEENNILTHNT